MTPRTFTSLRVWRPNFFVRHLMLNIFLAPQRDSTQTEAPRVVHTYTLGTSAALGMNCAVIPSFIIYTNVPRQSATAGLRLHGLLDSDQNNCQIVCEHCCSPSLTGNTTDTQRIQLSCHARPLLWCACARKQTFSGSDTGHTRIVRTSPGICDSARLGQRPGISKERQEITSAC